MDIRDLAYLIYPYWIVALVAAFVMIVVWSFWPSEKRKRQMIDHARIPLRDDMDRG